jgi:membrane fusion protein (multidrug efflux system)
MNRTRTPIRFALLMALPLSILACDAPEEGDAKEVRSETPAGGDPKNVPQLEAVRVETAAVAETKSSFRIVRPGEVEPKRDANVASAMGGLVEAVSVKTGDVVKTGATLARVDASLHSAQKQLAQVEVDDANRELKRLKSMGRAIASSRVDQAKTRLARAEAQLKISRIQTGRTVVRAPFPGVVAIVGVEKGEVAPPGALIARIVELDPAVIDVSVADRDVGGLDVGMEAIVTAGGKDLVGTVARIEPAANLKTRAFSAEVEVENANGALRPGMIATVEFRRTDEESQIVLPQDLIVTQLDANGVFVEDGGIARWRPLVLGDLVRDQIRVESGLKAGEKIVVLGHRGLSDGDPLIVEREGRCCEGGRVVFTSGVAAATPEPQGEAPVPVEKAEEAAG